MSVVITAGGEPKEYFLSEVGNICDCYHDGSSGSDLAYEESGIVEILPECQRVYDEDLGFCLAASKLPFVVGEAYIVNWNGVEYSCVAQDLSVLEEGMVGLGDLSSMVELDEKLTGNGEPFAIMATNGITAADSMDGSTKLTISIKVERTVVHKLDPKFLPEGVPYISEAKVKIPINGEWTYSNTSGQYIYNTNSSLGLEAGKTYVVNWNGVEYTAACIDMADLSSQISIPGVFMGNTGGVTGVDNGMPFTIMEVAPDTASTMGVYGVISGLDHTQASFDIYSIDKVGHKLDPKCLPDNATSFTLVSPNGTKFAITVSDNGTLSAMKV